MEKKWWEDFPESESQNRESDFHKLKVGENKVRILTQFEKANQLYEGVYPNSKYLGLVEDDYVPKKGEEVVVQGWAWAVIRETGELKILQVGKGILKLLAQLRANEEYAFEDFPMPYDVNIHNTGDGPTRYSITAARKNSEVSPEEVAELEKKTPVENIIKRIKEKAGGKVLERVAPEVKAAKEPIEYPADEINPDDIPF